MLGYAMDPLSVKNVLLTKELNEVKKENLFLRKAMADVTCQLSGVPWSQIPSCVEALKTDNSSLRARIETYQRDKMQWSTDMKEARARVETLQREKTQCLKETKEERRRGLQWQVRCDLLLDQILCRECEEEKDAAYHTGHGYDWEPNCCEGSCKLAKYNLQAGMDKHVGEFVIPEYFEKDPRLQALEKQLVN